jgi:hypothetical protein
MHRQRPPQWMRARDGRMQASHRKAGCHGCACPSRQQHGVVVFVHWCGITLCLQLTLGMFTAFWTLPAVSQVSQASQPCCLGMNSPGLGLGVQLTDCRLCSCCEDRVTPTLVGIILFIKDILSDILCCCNRLCSKGGGHFESRPPSPQVFKHVFLQSKILGETSGTAAPGTWYGVNLFTPLFVYTQNAQLTLGISRVVHSMFSWNHFDLSPLWGP